MCARLLPAACVSAAAAASTSRHRLQVHPQNRQNVMNGAQSMLQTLVNSNVTVCFSNPGTSEIYSVGAIDRIPEMRGVLCLFEGVATGAADGYARMTDWPACTLLHLGPGLGNGLANLHNARRAHTPMVNVVGDHATFHLQYNAPLTCDIEAIARSVSGWYRSSATAQDLPTDTAAAVRAALEPPGQVATLVLPSDCAWEPGGPPVGPIARPTPTPVPPERVTEIAKLLAHKAETVLLIGDQALREEGLRHALHIGQAAQIRVLGDRVNSRMERGQGRPTLTRLPYPVPQAVALLQGTRHMILAGTDRPVGFFAYPGQPSITAPPDCEFHVLAHPHEDVIMALAMLAEEIGATRSLVPPVSAERPPRPTGNITIAKVWQALAALMPADAIVSDESITSGRAAMEQTAGAPPHDWLNITGGAIGQGLPAALGAAIACPDRQVFAMESDGSAMYTLQALWSMAREHCNVITIMFNNGAYRILQGELARLCPEAQGEGSASMLDLTQPDIDWLHLAQGMGVAASRAADCGELCDQMQAAIRSRGPHFIEVRV